MLLCSGRIWQNQSPSPPNTLESGYQVAENLSFGVGGYGTILQLRTLNGGLSWSKMSSGTSEKLTDVWGSSGSDVFAVGYNGTILHYDGSSWSAMAGTGTTTYSAVWGSGGDDVFVAGSSGTILHYNGSTWSNMASPTSYSLNALWGSSGSDVFAVGSNGYIVHYGPNVTAPELYDEVKITSGTLNGHALAASGAVVMVDALQPIQGQVNVLVRNVHTNAAIFPVGYCWSWAVDHSSGYVELTGDGLIGESAYAVDIDLVAPNMAGTYYITLGAGASATIWRICRKRPISPRMQTIGWQWQLMAAALTIPGSP